MHPLVRDLYKRALFVGRDYPLGLDYVRRTWKRALRNPDNCPSCYCKSINNELQVILEPFSIDCEKELRKAVGKGRYMIREMIGVIQLKKYRSMNQRYGKSHKSNDPALAALLSQLQKDVLSTNKNEQATSSSSSETSLNGSNSSRSNTS
jgi:hypothetical protein